MVVLLTRITGIPVVAAFFVCCLSFIALTTLLTAPAAAQQAEGPPSATEAPGYPVPAGDSPAATAPDGHDHPHPVPPELTDEEKELIREFEEMTERWSETLVEMKTIQILYANGEDRSDAAISRFRAARNRGREQLRELFLTARRLVETRPDALPAVSLMATTIDYRLENSIYEDSYVAARMLIDAGLNVPMLYLMAARSAFLEGHFDEVMPMYESFVEAESVEKLDKVDHQLAGLLEIYPPLWQRELEFREADARQDDLPRVRIETTRGPFVVELFEDQAPNTVANFIQLIEEDFYEGLDFHQVVDNLLAMTGDPVGDGSGTSGRFIPDEHEREDARRIFRGSLFMAKIPDGDDGHVPNTASSQFIIAMVPLVPRQDSQTVFGRVIEGMDVVCSLRRIDPSEKKESQVVLPPDRILTTEVIRKRDHDYPVTYVEPQR